MAVTKATKFKNDTTKTRLGDFYQYVVALEYCLNAKDGDTVYIEQHGDVASNDITIETKHHVDENHQISDRHIDFWKTLKNWVENHDVIKEYKFLILVTTSNIAQSSKLIDWNNLPKEEKLSRLEQITSEKEIPKTIKPFIAQIFDYNTNYTKETLLNILDKFKISSNEPTIQAKINILTKEHPFFKSYPPQNRKNLVYFLITYIIKQAIHDSNSWQIDISTFNAYIQVNAKNYTEQSSPIPDLYKTEIADPDEYKGFVFIEEIKKIKFLDQDKKIQEASDNYFRRQKTIFHMLNNDPFISDNIADYQNDLLKRLKLEKDTCRNELPSNAEEDILRLSRKCYLDSMKMPLMQIKNYHSNQSFFQWGSIHDIVDNSRFKWLIEE